MAYESITVRLYSIEEVDVPSMHMDELDKIAWAIGTSCTHDADKYNFYAIQHFEGLGTQRQHT